MAGIQPGGEYSSIADAEQDIVAEKSIQGPPAMD